MPEYLPEGITAIAKLRSCQSARPPSGPPPRPVAAGLPIPVELRLANTFPGTEHVLPGEQERGLRIVGEAAVVEPALPFNTGDPRVGDFVIAPAAETGVPFSLGQVARLVQGDEAGDGGSYIIYEIWKARRLESGAANIFGRWTPLRTEIPQLREPPTRKRSRFGQHNICVADANVATLLAWPVRCSEPPHQDGHHNRHGELLLPFEVFDWLYLRFGLDFRSGIYASSTRGREYVVHLNSRLLLRV